MARDRKITPRVFNHFCQLIRQGMSVRDICWRTDTARTTFYEFANSNKRWKKMLVDAQKWKRMSSEEKLLSIRDIAKSKLEFAAAGFDPEQIDLSKASDWLRMAGLFQENPHTQVNVQTNTQVNVQMPNITLNPVPKSTEAVADKYERIRTRVLTAPDEKDGSVLIEERTDPSFEDE